MKLFAPLIVAAALVAPAIASDMGSLRLRIHEKDGACTITNESQCDGQNWTGSTCCADSSYECRWDDYGQNVKRCQKKGASTTSAPATTATPDSSDSWDSYDSESGSDWSDDYSGSDIVYVKDWEDCTAPNKYCENDDSYCIYHSQYYAQCKPETLPSGELCGQSDGTNEWLYDYCPSGESCEQKGTDYRCTKSSKHHHHRQKATHQKMRWMNVWDSCTDSDQMCPLKTVCVRHSQYYAQCKPMTLPAGELCGQNDGVNVWKYDRCPSGQKCLQQGTDFRCA